MGADGDIETTQWGGRRGSARVAAIAVAFAVVLATTAQLARGEAPDSFHAPDLNGYVADGEVHAVAHSAGRTYIGGEFEHVGPRVGQGVELQQSNAAVAADKPVPGSESFPEVAGGEVKAVVPDQHGGWYIGGSFTHVGGHAQPRLAHILPSGELQRDATGWNPVPEDTSGASDGEVLALAVNTAQDATGATETTLYVGGRFKRIGSENRDFLAAFKLDPTTGEPMSPGDENNGQPKPPTDPLDWNPRPNAAVHALAATDVTLDVTPEGSPTVQRDVPIVAAGGDFTEVAGDAGAADRFGVFWGPGAVNKSGDATVQGTAVAPAVTHTPATVRAVVIAAPEVQAAENPLTNLAIYTGGDFAGRAAAIRLRLDHSGTDALSPAMTKLTSWNPNANASVRALALHTFAPAGGVPLTRLYVGGSFTTLGQQTRERKGIAALEPVPKAALENACGTSPPTPCPATATSWAPEASGGGGAPKTVSALAAAGDAVYAGGDFTQIGALLAGEPPTPGERPKRNGLAALYADGAAVDGQAVGGQAKPSWDAKPAGGPVTALAVQGDRVYAGGGFNSVGADERTNLAAIGADGALDPNWHPAPNGSVEALAVAGETVYAGGLFMGVDDDPDDTTPAADRKRLAAFSATSGMLDPDWDPQTRLVCKLPDGETGPEICSYGGVGGSCSVLAGQTSCELSSDGVLTINATDEAVFVGGAFTHFGDAERRGIAALRPAGATNAGEATSWDPDATGVPGGPESPAQVRDIELTCDSVYAGGNFTRIGAGASQPERHRIAALDPNTGAAGPWDPSADGTVRAVALVGSKVIAGGSFNRIGGIGRAGIASLDAEGFGAGTGRADGWNPSADQAVRALAVAGDGQTVYAGGSFNSIGGVQRSHLAALEAPGVGDGTGDATAWNPSPNNTVEALAASAGNVYAGGSFTELATRAQSGLASFTAGPSGSEQPLACPRPAAPAAPAPEPSSPAAPPAEPAPAPAAPNPVPLPAPAPEESCANEVVGTPRSDKLKGTALAELFDALKGDDRIDAGDGDDCILAGKGSDKASGGRGDDVVHGGKGKDELAGDPGADVLAGDRGADRIAGGGGADVALGGPGRDRIDIAGGGRDEARCGAGVDRVIADRGDELRGCEKARVRKRAGRQRGRN